MKTIQNQLPVCNLHEGIALIVFMIVMMAVSIFQDAAAQDVKPPNQKDGDVQVQDTTRLVQIETKDGNKYIGHIAVEDRGAIRLRTEKLGMMELQRSEIVSITYILAKQMKEGAFWFDNPQATRHFWSPNGYGLKKGEAYYQNVWILFNQFSVGVTNNFTIGGGLLPGFLFGGAGTPVWITPKFSIPVSKDKFNIGLGGLLGTSSLSEKGSGFGILYGMTTFGDRDQNVTLGLGYGYASGKFNSNPTITVSAVVRVSARGYFITENYYLGSGSSGLVLLSFGGRRIVNRTGIDFGLFIPISSSTTTLVAIPWLGITAPLHKNK